MCSLTITYIFNQRWRYVLRKRVGFHAPFGYKISWPNRIQITNFKNDIFVAAMEWGIELWRASTSKSHKRPLDIETTRDNMLVRRYPFEHHSKRIIKDSTFAKIKMMDDLVSNCGKSFMIFVSKMSHIPYETSHTYVACSMTHINRKNIKFELFRKVFRW